MGLSQCLRISNYIALCASSLVLNKAETPHKIPFALPETTNLPFEAIIVGFVVGGISMALTN